MKVYLATPMNDKAIEEIIQRISDCASKLVKNDIDFFNSEPYAKHKAEIYKNDRVTPGLYYVKPLGEK